MGLSTRIHNSCVSDFMAESSRSRSLAVRVICNSGEWDYESRGNRDHIHVLCVLLDTSKAMWPPRRRCCGLWEGVILLWVSVSHVWADSAPLQKYREVFAWFDRQGSERVWALWVLLFIYLFWDCCLSISVPFKANITLEARQCRRKGIFLFNHIIKEHVFVWVSTWLEPFITDLQPLLRNALW